MIAHFREDISELDTSSSTLTSDIALNKAELDSPMGSYLTNDGDDESMARIWCPFLLLFVNSDRLLISATSIDEMDDCEGDLKRVETFPVETL